jgi:hypothetical protein
VAISKECDWYVTRKYLFWNKTDIRLMIGLNCQLLGLNPFVVSCANRYPFFYCFILEFTIALEKEVNKALLNLHSFGEQHNDPQFCDFLEGNFLNEQVEGKLHVYL